MDLMHIKYMYVKNIGCIFFFFYINEYVLYLVFSTCFYQMTLLN